MPKKFGTNTKKEEARERDAQKKKEKKDDEVRKAEDSFWRETDSKVNKKLEKEVKIKKFILTNLKNYLARTRKKKAGSY